MHFIDLAAQYQGIAARIQKRLKTVCEHGQFVMGPELAELETQLADYVGVKHAIGVSSGTAALQMALMALDVGPGDEIIMPGFSFFATAEVALLLGAKPVMVDIDPATFNVNPACIEAAITEKTKAMMPVSLYGQPADMHAINALAKRYHLPVIEDGAQSFGATYHGKRSGALSTMAATSFFPSKPLGCYGDGGALFTDDDDLAAKIRCILCHGEQGRYRHVRLGLNARMDTMQAAILLEKLAIFDDELAHRQRVARWYRQAFPNEIAGVVLPTLLDNTTSAYAQMTLRLQQRDRVRQACMNAGIPTAIHYPVGMHQQPVYQAYHPEPLHLLQVEQAAATVLSVPCHPYLKQHEVEQVVEHITATLSMPVEA